MTPRASIITMVCLWLVVFAGARADTITLKDGTTLTGTIVSETDSSVSIEISNASGTITRQEIISRADIASYHRLTEAERVERAMTDEYIKLQKYTLKPDSIEPKEYYDQIITNVFRPFLSRYPSSPYEKEVTDTIAQWEAERNKVAAGLVKFHGEWVPETEAKRDRQFTETQDLLKEAEAMASAGKWEKTVADYEAILALGISPGAMSIARRQLPEAYRKLDQDLRQRLQQFDKDQPGAQQRIGQLQQAVPQAQNALAKAQDQLRKNNELGGAATAVIEAQVKLRNVTAQLNASQGQLAQLQRERNAVKQTLDGLPGRASQNGIDLTSPEATPATATAAKPANVSSEVETPGLLTEMRQFFQNNWIYLAAAGAVALVVLSRILTR